MQDTGKRRDVGANKPVSSEETVVARKKVKRKYRLRIRRASCFCSACQRSQYQDCHVNETYSGIVPALTDKKVEETVVMDTGVAPGGVEAPPVAPVSGAMPKDQVCALEEIM